MASSDALHIDSLEETGQLKQAIDTNDVEGVKALMTRNPQLHRAPLGYAQNGPLTWVAECRVPWEPPGPARLGMAQWMIENGSDVHQGGDGPLMRAALNGQRIPMMELLVSYGADVNAEWNGDFKNGVRSLKAFAPLADCKLDEVTVSAITGFVEERRRGGLQISSINRLLEVLRRMLRLSVEWGVIEKAPPKIEMLPGENERDRVLTHQEEGVTSRRPRLSARESKRRIAKRWRASVHRRGRCPPNRTILSCFAT